MEQPRLNDDSSYGGGGGGPPSPGSLRALSEKVDVDKILTSMDDASASAAGASSNRRRVRGGGGTSGMASPRGDDVSTLSGGGNTLDDDASVASSLWRASAAMGSVLTQSLAILRGEALAEEEGEGNRTEIVADADGDSSPLGAVAVPVSSQQSDRFDDEGRNASLGTGTMQHRESARSLNANGVGIDFLRDDPKEMTYSRRIALSLMSKNWYYPRPKDEEGDDGLPEGDGEEAILGGVGGATDGTSGRMDFAAFEGTLSKDTLEKERARVKMQRAKSSSVFTERGELKVFELTHRPDLAKAWAYFEHITLPRYIIHEKQFEMRKGLITRCMRKLFSKGNKQLDRAEPGEDDVPTRLYSPIFTPLKQMGDFGLGVGLYFSTLRAITVMTFLAGIINMYNFVYFNGEEYNRGRDAVDHWLLYGSAICANQNWVPCPTCDPDDFRRQEGRLAMGTSDSGESVLFAMQNQCERPPFKVGMVNYGTLLFVIVGMFVMSRYQKAQEVAFDEDEQTTQDYSVVVQNPPPDATEPEEWKSYFEDNFDDVHATCVTVGLDNDLLVRSLVERRRQLLLLQMALPPGTDMSVLNLAKIAGEMERRRNGLQNLLAKLIPGVPEHFAQLAILNAKVQGLAQQEYPSTNIFVTFETEEAQRQVLSALNVGSVAIKRNDASSVQPHHLFRGTKVLRVTEADEPSTVRWEDLNAKFASRVKTLAITSVATLCAVVLTAFIVVLCRNRSTVFGAYAIAAFNAIFPVFAKFLTNMESHKGEGEKQASLYVKIALFRWVNTAIVMTIIVPFTSTLTEGTEHLLTGVATIFFAEITTTNVIQLADPVGHLQRHFLAPRAKTQEAMNILMQGQIYELAERYTNMTKILFLALWYCSIYPCALFLCSFALFINFFTDRFSLMRTWKPAPMLGATISAMSRKYFFSIAMCAMAVVGSYMWTGFPFDNLCDGEETNQFQGQTWNLTSLGDNPTTEAVSVTSNSTVRYCNQDLLRYENVAAFPALPVWQPEGDEWMTADQERLTSIYGWTSVAVCFVVLLIFVSRVLSSVRGLFRGTYKPNGEVQGVNFSDVPAVAAYIPEVAINFLPFPLIATDIDNVDEELFQWEDADKPYSYYDLTRDAEQLLAGTDCTKDASKHVFTKIKHWPPPRPPRAPSSKSVDGGGAIPAA